MSDADKIAKPDGASTQSEAQVSTQPKLGSDMPLWIILALIGVLVIGTAIWFKWFHVSTPEEPSAPMVGAGAPRVIVIDTSKIIAAATKKVLGNPNASAAEEGGKLSAKLSSVLQEYRNGGALILNGYTVIYCPPDMDKTAEVAAKVGVTLE